MSTTRMGTGDVAGVALMVVDLLDEQALAEWFPRQRSPAGALNVRGGRRELLLERGEAAEVCFSAAATVPGGLAASLRA